MGKKQPASETIISIKDDAALNNTAYFNSLKSSMEELDTNLKSNFSK